ncbi:MAG: hypothetical protein II464_06620, partial [Oscillospiraceae bacterium]|nr:hypothetical protein [Oscillospiraceae bacterium]
VGILARSAEDTALVLDIISGSDSSDRYSSKADELKPEKSYADSLGDVSMEGLKIGYLSNSFGYYVSSSGRARSKPTELSPLIKDMVDGALEVFTSNGAELVDMSEYLTEPYIRRLSWMGASRAREAVRKIFEEHGISAIVYVSQTDVPEVERKAIGRYNNPAYYISIFSPKIGLPEIMVPMGLSDTDPEAGVTEPLPLGLSIVGLYGRDAVLLGIASEYDRLSNMRYPPACVPVIADEGLERFGQEVISAAADLLSEPALSYESGKQIAVAYAALKGVSMTGEAGTEEIPVSEYRQILSGLCVAMDAAQMKPPAEPAPEVEPERSSGGRDSETVIGTAVPASVLAASALIMLIGKKKRSGSAPEGINGSGELRDDIKELSAEEATMKKPVLVIMAAGMGSRFGGLKQIAPVDDSGHIIMDYSLYDAHRAGFDRVVFVIKKEIEEEFKAAIGDRVSRYLDVSYVFQDVNDLPEGFSVPDGRVKPWGTGHAVASCREVIDAPFAVINADDFYGRSAFRMIYDFLSGEDVSGRYAMVGFRLRNTLTENGSVARGQCFVQDGLLTGVVERTEIYPSGDDAQYRAEDGSMTDISGDTVVSMNFWGFSSDMAKVLWQRFPAYLEAGLKKDPVKFEYYLPSVVNDQINDGTCTVTVLTCEDSWHGVTYTEDLPDLKNAIRQMIEDGTYPVSLWD